MLKIQKFCWSSSRGPLLSFSVFGHGWRCSWHRRFPALGNFNYVAPPWGVTMLRNCPKHVKMSTLMLFTEEDVIDYSFGTWNHLFSLFWWTLILFRRTLSLPLQILRSLLLLEPAQKNFCNQGRSIGWIRNENGGFTPDKLRGPMAPRDLSVGVKPTSDL